MQKRSLKSTVVTMMLILTLFTLIGAIAKNVYDYYRGPDYIVDTYVKYLNQKDYLKLYSLLDSNSISGVGGKEKVADYYKRIYEKENKLISTQRSGNTELHYKLQYQYAKGRVQDTIRVIQTKGKWHIEFPFEMSDVEVFAPYGAKVYLDSKVMKYSSNESYKLEDILPGTYLLKVEPGQEGYKDYYKILHIPEEKRYIVPYELAHVTIQVAPCFKVQCNQFTKVTQKTQVAFDDLLLGTYQITAQDVNGFFEPQSLNVQVNKGENVFKLKTFKLSNKGEKTFKSFLETFYDQYIDAIKEHDVNLITSYFTNDNAKVEKDLFSSWYIEQKDISKVNMKVKIGESTVDEKGYIHVEIIENVELENQEYDEEGKLEKRNYKVILTWETLINPLSEDWKIMQREIKQSMVAVEDKEGRWIQY